MRFYTSLPFYKVSSFSDPSDCVFCHSDSLAHCIRQKFPCVVSYLGATVYLDDDLPF